MNSNEYCTVLEVECIVCTEIFGFTFWVDFIKFIDQEGYILEGIIYFLDKSDALNLDIGNQVHNHVVFNPANSKNKRNTFFNGQ